MSPRVEKGSDLTQREKVGGRYRILGELGRGGVAVVYRVADDTDKRELALKQLCIDKNLAHYEDTALLFEHEFQTLRQLSHPRIIEVYEFGIEEQGPYYTMELLDGGDLKQRAPMPWREACSLIFDVCSSLALLHSRGLLHRDISPRNVRCGKDGSAKLIDFGAMVPMGQCHTIVGTPPFVAPEALLRSTLDARADLFSLGASLYSALTGQLAFPARKFDQLMECWRTPPPVPSSFAPEIPAALDTLVMSLISIDLGARPRSAADVMPRLAAIAGIERVEPVSVSQAYLSAPVLVGRRNALAAVKKRIARSKRGRGSAVLIRGPAGSGRSRMLDAFVLDAQIMGATVLRGGAQAGKDRRFALVQSLLQQLNHAQPELLRSIAASSEPARLLYEFDPAEADHPTQSFTRTPPWLKELDRLDERTVQEALHAFLLDVSAHVHLVVVVDDLDGIEPASAGVLAGLAQAAEQRPFLLIGAREPGASTLAPVALELFSNQALPIELDPLSANETEALLRSVFGDVPHVATIAQAIYEISRGNPRECMELAQHLVDRNIVRYEGGTWTLPSRLETTALPASVEDALLRRAAGLSPLARTLAECHALTRHAKFEREDYLGLCQADTREHADAAIAELVAQQVVLSDGIVYMLAHKAWNAALARQLTPAEAAERQRALANLSEQRGRHPLLAIDHLLAAGEQTEALDRLARLLDGLDDANRLIAATTHMLADDIGKLFENALALAQRSGRRPREINTLARWVTMFSFTYDDSLYWKVAPDWLACLKRDSGLDAYLALDPALPAQERLQRAVETAITQYNQTPEAERVYKFDEAIRLLVYYVGLSIAIGARAHDEALLESLPALLEPFAPLSPTVHSIWQNALATREAVCLGQSEQGRKRWLDALAQLDQATGVDPRYIQIVRGAMSYGVAMLETAMGLPSAEGRLDELSNDVLQSVNAMHLRKIIRLQQGDWAGAEQCRRDAELLAVRTNVRSLFNGLVHLELDVYALGSDLTGVKRARELIEPLAARHRGWLPFLHLADGHLLRLRGDVAGARRAFEAATALCAPDAPPGKRGMHAWVRATGAYLGALTELGLLDEASACGTRALEICKRYDVRYAGRDLVRAIALSEAKRGEHAQAARRLDELIALTVAEGVTGLELGAAYEARARIAIWSGDEAAFDRYAQLTALQYRRGDDSALGARYDRLLAEARGSGMLTPGKLADFATTLQKTSSSTAYSSQQARVDRALQGTATPKERADRMLELLCNAKGAVAGHLFLCGSAGLSLAASTEPNAPAALLREAQTYLDMELESSDTDTMTVTRAALRRAEPPSVTGYWTDPDGHRYRPVTLSAMVDGIRTYVGVVALCIDDAERERATLSELLETIAERLIECGDVKCIHA